LDADSRFTFELNLQCRLFGTRRPEIDCVDRIVRGRSSHEAQTDLDVVGTDLTLDRFQDLQTNLLGTVDTGAGLSAQTQLKLTGDDDRKNLRAERTADKANEEAANGQVGKDHYTPVPNSRRDEPRVKASKAFEQGHAWLMVPVLGLQEPDREHGHQSARQD